MTQPKLFRIVLTGGPCGGKTTALVHVTERLRSLGFNTYVVPEAATMMILGGISLMGSDPSSVAQMQGLLLKLQMAHEQAFTEAARASGKDSVIIMDRGTMDSSAFVEPVMWQALLDENGWTKVGLRDKHYDAVIHLVSAAIGAPDSYTLENNAARSETPEEAAANDLRIRNAWLGHPHLRVIDNSTDFAGKIHRVLQAISNVVGIPEPVETERKFLVSAKSDFGNTKVEHVEIEQTYLKCTNGVARVRKRGQYGSYTYTHTVKHYIGPGKNVELERLISSREYLNLLSQADPEMDVIRKRRSCFLWEHQYYELDSFWAPLDGLIILEAEIEDDNEQLSLPPFITIEREVTADKNYSNAALARKK